MSGTVLGIFNSLPDAEKAMAALKKKGYDNEHIGILARGLEDTQMQIPAGNQTTNLGLAGGTYPDYGLHEPAVFSDIQDTLSAGAMTSPEHAQTSYVEQGVNRHEAESTDDNTTSYAVGGYFTAATDRGEPFNPTYGGYTGLTNQAGSTGDWNDGQDWSSYPASGTAKAGKYATTARMNNETMPAFHATGKAGVAGSVGDGKKWSNYGGKRAAKSARGANNGNGDEFVLAVRVDANQEISNVMKTLTQRGAVDTETFINNDK